MAIELAAQIAETYWAYDPSATTVCVGGAAMHLQLAAGGVLPNNTKDFEALCSPDYYADLLVSGPQRDDLSSLTVEWPTGQQRVMGAMNQSIHLAPSSQHRQHRLKASYATRMGSPRAYVMEYGDCTDENVVVVNDIRCLALPTIFEWKAILGRRKDLNQIDQALKRSWRGGLLTKDQYDRIKEEHGRSAALLEEHPERFYARIPESRDNTHRS